MGVSQKSHSGSELHAANLFADVPTSRFEADDEEATRVYIAPLSEQLSSSLLMSVKPSRHLAPESVASIGGWDASTTSSALGVHVSAKPPFRAPPRSSTSKTLFAAFMGIAVVLTGGGAMYAATRLSGNSTAQRAPAPSPVASTVAAAPLMLPPAAIARPSMPALAPAVAQPKIASVETLYAAMQADKTAKAAEVAAASSTKGAAKRAVVAQASKPVKVTANVKVAAPVKVVATSVAKAPTPLAKAPTSVRPVKASELDDAL